MAQEEMPSNDLKHPHPFYTFLTLVGSQARSIAFLSVNPLTIAMHRPKIKIFIKLRRLRSAENWQIQVTRPIIAHQNHKSSS